MRDLLDSDGDHDGIARSGIESARSHSESDVGSPARAKLLLSFSVSLNLKANSSQRTKDCLQHHSILKKFSENQ